MLLLQVLLVLRPTHPRCSSGSGACSALTCCNGRNPFRGFRLSVSAERTVFPVDGNLSVGVPNAECIDKAACKAGNTAHCRGDCIASVCCTAFATYTIAFPAESAARWVVGVTGADGSSDGSSDASSSTSRFTDSFQLDVKVSGAADAALLAFGSSGSAIRILAAAPVAVNDGDSGGSAGGSSMRDKPDGPVSPEGRYAFQVCIRQHTSPVTAKSAYVRIRQHTSPVLSPEGRHNRQRMLTSAYGSIRQHTRQPRGICVGRYTCADVC